MQISTDDSHMLLVQSVYKTVLVSEKVNVW